MADVIVLGGGIIGLTSAVRLAEAGADVTVWAPDDPRDTVSSIAAAVWYPTHTDYAPRLLTWAGRTYDEFTRQAAAGVPGVLLRATRNLEREASGAVPWWASAARDVTIGPAAPPYARTVRFTAPLVEMNVYLPWLRSRVTVRRRAVTDLAEALAEAPVVVNATGLAAGRLAGDPDVFPARGQIVLVANPGLTESVRAGGDPGSYVHPRSSDVVLGGTFEVGRWDTGPDPATRATILRRCTALVPALAGAPVLGERVGLRPCRTGGPRVERDGAVVHAYGHGGAGMTLAWGCADEVTALVTGGVTSGR